MTEPPIPWTMNFSWMDCTMSFVAHKDLPSINKHHTAAELRPGKSRPVGSFTMYRSQHFPREKLKILNLKWYILKNHILTFVVYLLYLNLFECAIINTYEPCYAWQWLQMPKTFWAFLCCIAKCQNIYIDTVTFWINHYLPIKPWLILAQYYMSNKISNTI